MQIKYYSFTGNINNYYLMCQFPFVQYLHQG